jgi:hypothetical protein
MAVQEAKQVLEETKILRGLIKGVETIQIVTVL